MTTIMCQIHFQLGLYSGSVSNMGHATGPMGSSWCSINQSI